MGSYYKSRWETGQAHSYSHNGQVRHVDFWDFANSRPTIPWLWEPYLAAGTIAILDGDPGVGKSLIAIDIMSRLAADQTMPDGTLTKADIHLRPVFVVNNEDPHETVLMPRFMAANCPSHRLIFYGGLSNDPPLASCDPIRPTQFPHDWPHFAAKVKLLQPSLVVIDPIAAVFSAGMSTGNDQQFREALTPFAELAQKTGTCFLFVRHLTKKGAMKSLYRGAGTIGVAGAARSVLLVSVHSENPDHRILAVAKTNFGEVPPSQQFRIVPRQMYLEHDHGPPTPFPPIAKIEWLGPTPIKAQDLCDVTLGQEGATFRAMTWLQNELAQGPKPQSQLAESANKAGITYRTLQNAKKQLGIRSKRIADGDRARWEWEIK